MNEQTDFAINQGGVFDRLAQHLGMANRVLVRAAALTAIAWLPLLILSASEGLASVRIPSLCDYGVYGRLLVALPVLVLGEVLVGTRTRDVLRQFIKAGLVREQDMADFSSAVRQATRRKESVIPELVILCVVYASSVPRIHLAVSDSLTTWYSTGGGVSAAGWYYALVSLPLFHFLLLRLMWWTILWALLLWRISRMDLHLLPTHPDKMGGLAFLGLSQIPFGLLGFAGGSVVSSYLINSMVYRGASLQSSVTPMVVFVVPATLFAIAPVLVFTKKLILTRADGMLKYGVIGQEYVSLFDQKWAKRMNPEGEAILGSSDIQSLADLRNSFDIVQNMSIVAVDRKTALIIGATAALPMIPLFLIVLPLDKIIASILGLRN